MQRLLASITALAAILAAPWAGAATTAQKAMASVVPHGIYVDSVAGNNTNSGASPSQALKDVTSIPVLKSGATVFLKRGSIWNEDLFIGIPGSAVNNITVKDYGQGPLPTLDASNVITGVWTNVTGNQWSITVTGPGTTYSTLYGTYTLAGPWVNVFECKSAPCTPTGAGGNDTTLQNASTQAGAQSNGFVFIPGMTSSTPPTYGTSNAITLYVQASDGSNPNTNGYVYTYSARPNGLNLVGTGLKVYNIRCLKSADNNGCMSLIGPDGNSSFSSGVVADQGGKHNMIVSGGSTVNGATFHDEYYPGAGNMLVGFDGTGSGLSVTFNNTTCIDGVLATNNQVGCLFAHAGSGSLGPIYTNNTLVKATSSTVTAFSGNSFANTTMVFDTNTICDNTLVCITPMTPYTIVGDQVVSSHNLARFIDYGSSAATPITVTNAAWCITNGQTAAIRDINAGAVALTLTGSLGYANTPQSNGAFAAVSTGGTTGGPIALTANNNVLDGALINQRAWFLATTGSTFTGSGNSYKGPNTIISWELNGTIYSTLATWKAAVTPQDANALTTASGLAACTLPAGA